MTDADYFKDFWSVLSAKGTTMMEKWQAKEEKSISGHSSTPAWSQPSEHHPPWQDEKAKAWGTRAGRGGTGKYDHSFPTQFTILLSPSLLTTGPVNSENLSLALLEDQPDDLKDKTRFIQEVFILADSAENKMWKAEPGSRVSDEKEVNQRSHFL